MDKLPDYVKYAFTATDNFPVTPRPVRVLVYFEPSFGLFLVDIQTWTLQGTWRDGLEPWGSTSEEEALEYYNELKDSDTYTNIEVLRA